MAASARAASCGASVADAAGALAAGVAGALAWAARHDVPVTIFSAGIGRFGPYIKLGSTYQSLEPGDDVLTLRPRQAGE